MQSAEMKSLIDAALADIDKLPAFPALVNRVLTMVSNPDADIKALAEEISMDPGITAGVLRLSNSAYYKPSRQIRSVQEAIVTLGLRTVKDIILVTASKGILKKELEGYRMEAKELWDHSLLVAEISATLAREKKGKTPADVAFTAGLLHDVGKVVLANYFRRIYRQIAMEMEKDNGLRFTDLEQKYMGYNHSELGGKLLQIWNFPDELVEAVGNYYHPDQAKLNPELCSMVHVGNVVALAAGVGVDSGGMAEELSPFALKTLGLDDKTLGRIYEQLPEKLEALEDMRTM